MMANKDKTRIFIECTQTFFVGGNSGIQRVVRNLVNNGRELTNEDVEVHPLVWAEAGFCRPRRKLSLRKHIWFYIKRSFHKYSKYIFHSRLKKFRRLVRRLLGWKQWYSARKLPWALKAILFFVIKIVVGDFVEFRRGDIVVLVDSTWKSPLMLDALSEAKNDRGVVLGGMIHDLFPLLMPEQCEEITVEYFTTWFQQMVPMMDFFVVNSESTRKSLTEYLEKCSVPEVENLICGSFRLGAELDGVGEKIKNPEQIQPVWDTPGRALLAIGTVEPRKNYSYLLDAYDLLRAGDIDVSLIIVGRLGWKNGDVVNRIKNHPDFESRLLLLNHAGDWELAEAIERADCLVCPSIAEGFGLPVVEGLMRGLTVFASDIPVFHESGEGFCRFFDPASPVSLAESLEQWYCELLHPATVSKSPVQDFSWPNWKESTVEFIALVTKLAAEAETHQRKHR